jgi:hypothetical protein
MIKYMLSIGTGLALLIILVDSSFSIELRCQILISDLM